MQIMHIEGRYKGETNPENINAEQIPRRIALFTTVQFMDHIGKIKEYLENKGKKVTQPTTNAYYRGQVLGCSIKKLEGYEAILYVGDGEFHPVALALENNIPVYTFNPFSEKFDFIRDEQVQRMVKMQKSAIAKFYHSEKVGILVSLKPGQFRPKVKEELEKKHPEKKFFTFVFDTLNPASLEDFNFIECFVNTSCPRISFDDYSKFNNKIVEHQYVL